MNGFFRTSANIFAFYKSTLTVTFSASLLGLVFGGFEIFKIILIVFGFWISILMKEVNSKNEYLFYYNNGISKHKLVSISFLMNVVFSVLIILIFNQIMYLYD